jgi:hypothetical protein
MKEISLDARYAAMQRVLRTRSCWTLSEPVSPWSVAALSQNFKLIKHSVSWDWSSDPNWSM